MLNLCQALEAGLMVSQGDRDESVLHVTDLSVAIGETCPRQLFLRLTGADRKLLTAGQMLMFRHGHRIHADIVEILKIGLPGEWEIEAVEYPMSAEGIIGTCDCILTSRTHERVIADFKTIRGRAFNWLEGAKPAHVLQVQSYMFLLHESTGKESDYGLVLYVDREGQNAFKQFAVPRNDAAVIEAIAATNMIVGGEMPPVQEPLIEVKENKGPDSIKLKQPWTCDYCQYQDVSCHGALPRELRDLGIIGHFDGSDFKAKDNVPAKAVEMAEELLKKELIPF